MRLEAAAPYLLDAGDIATHGIAHLDRPTGRRMFIGQADRKAPKPPCISAATDRACARATSSEGQNPHLG